MVGLVGGGGFMGSVEWGGVCGGGFGGVVGWVCSLRRDF
jgi:hypothetical protein